MNAVAAQPSWPRWLAWGLCLLTFALIVGDVVHSPLKHTTMPTYRAATTNWWEGIDPYSTNENAGFLYLPQAAFLFTPFNVLPFFGGEILWRVFTFGLFVYALVRLNDFFLAGRESASPRSFLVLVLLAVPSSFASLRNAQFDLPLAALIVLATAEIAGARWSTAALWLCLAIALKPLAVVPLLLFGTLFRSLLPRLAVGLLLVVALPFLHWNPAFVAHEYARCWETLAWASGSNAPKFSDLFALLSLRLHVTAPDAVKTATRVIFALAYFALGWAAVRRIARAHAVWAVGALSADYLMLFNPRTETCSYVMLGPFVASLAILLAVRGDRVWLARTLGVAALGFACDAFPRLGAFSVHDLTDRWFKPLLALLFLPVLAWFILRKNGAHQGMPVTSRT